MRLRSLAGLVVALVTLTAAAPNQPFHLSSSAFLQGQPIPQTYSNDGGNQIPPLSWWGAPSNTQEFVLLVYDPDAPQVGGSPFIHWLVYGIPAATNNITGALAIGVPQAANSFGLPGWNGPMPPVGSPPHRYVFALYALDTVPTYPYAASSSQVFQAMSGHILSEAILTGTFQRG